MWTPTWFNVLFMVFTSPATWVAVGIVLVLLVGLLLWAAWRLVTRSVQKGGV